MADGEVITGGVGQLASTNGGSVVPEGFDPNPQPEEEDVPMLDISINNVVCSFNTKCHLNLKRIAMEGTNVEYHRQHGMLNMRLRNPYTTASVWSSGKVTCTGALSEEFSKIAARKFARKIQKMGYKVKFTNFRVVNVLGTCSLPFALDITKFSRQHKEASYEPELHPGVTYRIKTPKATLKIFSTGSITVTAAVVLYMPPSVEWQVYPKCDTQVHPDTGMAAAVGSMLPVKVQYPHCFRNIDSLAPCVANVQSAIEYIYPLVADFNAGPRSVKTSSSVNNMMNKRLHQERKVMDDESDFDGTSMEDSDEEFDSDVSQD